MTPIGKQQLKEMMQRGFDLDDNETSKKGLILSGVFDVQTGGNDEWIFDAIIEVAMAICAKKTFEFIEQSESHHNIYLLVMNLPFFTQRTSYGVSIRGSFWHSLEHNPISPTCLFDNEFNQVQAISFSSDANMTNLIMAAYEFAHEI